MNKFNLSASDYNYLIKFVKTGKKTGKELERAYILLALHQNLKQREIAVLLCEPFNDMED